MVHVPMQTAPQSFAATSALCDRPEIELLLCCARTQLDCAIAERIEALLRLSLNWTYLLRIASQHGVMLLLYQNLAATCPSAVPKDILNQLRQYSYKNALRNASLTQELINIIRLLEKNNIPAIPFKGPVLAASAYDNLALRKFSDLDILVRQQDFAKTIEVLIHQGGYQLGDRTWHFLSHSREEAFIHTEPEYALHKHGVVIDLHQSLTPRCFLTTELSFEYMWEKRQSLSIAGHVLDGFSVEDSLLYLCIHTAKECWRSLKWLCDIAEFIGRHPAIDWMSVSARSKELGIERRVWVSLLLVHEILQVPLPTVAQYHLQLDPAIQPLAQQIASRLFVEKPYSSAILDPKKTRFHLKTMECWQNKFRYSFCYFSRLLQAAVQPPTSKDLEFWHLPRSWYRLYYLIRPVRLIWQRSTH
ncbi:MAG: nucleotidyltransferase family protein [Cyanothece sp. SIO1E1]|nr:nucleotidyltransferase family protein [Cyanothece sp. SIO1E1]